MLCQYTRATYYKLKYTHFSDTLNSFLVIYNNNLFNQKSKSFNNFQVDTFSIISFNRFLLTKNSPQNHKSYYYFEKSHHKNNLFLKACKFQNKQFNLILRILNFITCIYAKEQRTIGLVIVFKEIYNVQVLSYDLIHKHELTNCSEGKTGELIIN